MRSPTSTQLTRLLTPSFTISRQGDRATTSKSPSTATVEAILRGKRRVLLTMATGTGKTARRLPDLLETLAARWNRTGRAPTTAHPLPRRPQHPHRRPQGQDIRALRRRPLEDRERRGQSRAARCTSPSTRPSPRTRAAPASTASIAPDFFDLIIVDECHRGSARDESNWREILEYFEPAYQLGMTATPLREDNRDTYRYFGNPIYTYSLRQGIEDGFLAPYRVHRVITEWDAAGWRPEQGRARPLRPRDPRRGVPDQRLRARRRPARAHRSHRPAPD